MWLNVGAVPRTEVPNFHHAIAKVVRVIVATLDVIRAGLIAGYANGLLWRANLCIAGICVLHLNHLTHT